MFLLLAELTARPSAVSEVEFILCGLVDVARHERGNIAYAVHQPLENPHGFVLYELYKDRSACDEHLASAPVRQALTRFEALLAEPPRIVFCSMLASSGAVSLDA